MSLENLQQIKTKFGLYAPRLGRRVVAHVGDTIEFVTRPGVATNIRRVLLREPAPKPGASAALRGASLTLGGVGLYAVETDADGWRQSVEIAALTERQLLRFGPRTVTATERVRVATAVFSDPEATTDGIEAFLTSTELVPPFGLIFGDLRRLVNLTHFGAGSSSFAPSPEAA
ncbi:MAG: hypothetical protein U0169_02055 [Polyangiaceae bacterium]